MPRLRQPEPVRDGAGLVSGAFWRRVHFGLMLAWTALLVPTLAWWMDSVPWIVFMSWYAIVVSHFAAWQAARAEESAAT